MILFAVICNFSYFYSSQQTSELGEDLGRQKRLLDDRHFESLRLNDENGKKNDSNTDLRIRASDLEKEIEVLKLQKADNWREIGKLKDMNEQRVRDLKKVIVSTTNYYTLTCICININMSSSRYVIMLI